MFQWLEGEAGALAGPALHHMQVAGAGASIQTAQAAMNGEGAVVEAAIEAEVLGAKTLRLGEAPDTTAAQAQVPAQDMVATATAATGEARGVTTAGVGADQAEEASQQKQQV